MKKKAYTLFLLVFTAAITYAQETLSNLEVNILVKKEYSEQKDKVKTKSGKASLELPFFDDFAKPSVYPDAGFWIDKQVYINHAYPVDAISIGVATFDAINEKGGLDSVANQPYFGADTLTSQPINLNYPGDNTIYLSFYYQPGGLGDAPEKRDSLILEYYAVDSVKWYKAWYVTFNEKDSVLSEYYVSGENEKTIKGDTITNLMEKFQQVIVAVDHDRYLKNNFQFRFRNIASVSKSADFPSTTGNADMWNLDYVLLNKDRNANDSISRDVAVCTPIGSLLKNYQAIPWTHFQKAIAYEMLDTISMTYRNMRESASNPNRIFEVTDLMGNTGTILIGEGTDPHVEPRSKYTYWRPSGYIFPYNTANDSALFDVKAILETGLPNDSIHFMWNDTTHFYQKFYNYYAYDDGTAENGYGIMGTGTESAKVAMKFNTYTQDTLRGIQMYFNQTLNNSNQYGFKIHVWKNEDEKPGEIIYTLEGAKPQNVEELNKFQLFVFDETIVLNGEFFIGWQKQNTIQMLNVGFDVNTINNDKLYYNFSGNWVKSSIEGTVMMRPMFGHELDVPTGIKENKEVESLDFKIYPNPATDYLNIALPENLQKYRYTIFDITGRIFMDIQTSETNIDISSLDAGIYYIRFSNTKSITSTKKFIKIK